jgi:hypothetical protein
MSVSSDEPRIEVDVTPGDGIVRLEDLGTSDHPESVTVAGEAAGYEATRHSVDLYTMSFDESDLLGRDVRVRVYAGEPDDSTVLGQLTFDGQLDITSGVLGIGELIDEPDTMHQVKLARAGTVHVKVYTAKAVPVSGPTDVAIVLDPEALPGS